MPESPKKPDAPVTDQSLVKVLTDALNANTKAMTPKPRGERMVVHGVEPEISESDAEQIAFAVMAEVVCKTDDRGDIAATIPLYQLPLMKRLYQRRGGECRLTADWLYHPKRKLESRKPRTIPLSRLTISFEMERLQKRHAYMTAAGKVSDFDKVFGAGINNRFKKVVIDMAKAYKRIAAECERDGRRISLDDLEIIAAIGEPESEGERDLEKVSMEPEIMPSDDDGLVVTDDDDPSYDLQNYMTDKGHDPEIALNVARLHAENRVTPDALRAFPLLGSKKEALGGIMRDYKLWQADWAKRSAKASVA